MAVDKLVDSSQLDTDLTSVANAIRTKGGTSAQLAFPSGFVTAIGNIQTGGGISLDDIASGAFPSGDIVLPNTITSVYDYAFCYRIKNNAWTISGPEVTYLGQNALRGSTYLTAAYFPKLTSIHNTSHIFYGNTRLAIVDWGLMAVVKENTFTNCSALKTLILRKSDSIVSNNATSTFNGTPFASGGTGGTIYIPKALYDHLGDNSSLDYKYASNWSTVDGYGTITWAKIEGSVYELT